MSNTAKRINSINRIDHNIIRKKVKDNKGNLFNSLTDAANFWKIHISTICDILHKRHSKTRKGVIFTYES